jgi:hypothetical protein
MLKNEKLSKFVQYFKRSPSKKQNSFDVHEIPPESDIGTFSIKIRVEICGLVITNSSIRGNARNLKFTGNVLLEELLHR